MATLTLVRRHILVVPFAVSTLLASTAFAKLATESGFDGRRAAKPSKNEPQNVVVLGPIDGESDAKMSVLNIRFSEKPSWDKVPEIQDHGTFLQITLPGTLVPEPGKFYEGGNPDLTKIAAFQLTPSDAAVRIFTAKDASKVKQALSADVLANRIVITVDRQKLDQLVASTLTSATSEIAGPEVLVGPPAPPGHQAAVVIAKTEVRTDIAAPSEVLKADAKQAKQAVKLAGPGFDLQNKLVNVAAFFGVMTFLMGLSMYARPILRRRAAAKAGLADSAISMKTLANLALAPKQKVSLIQVGDEKILIGVTPDAVTFLTTIGRQQVASNVVPNFSRMMTENQMSTVDLHAAPMLKKIEGNDPESLRESPRQSAPKNTARDAYTPAAQQPQRRPSANGAPVPAAKRLLGKRINVAVGEDGVQDFGAQESPVQTTNKQTIRRPVSGTASMKATAEIESEPKQAIDDVTRMIREKLKNLRNI